jgi:heme/copper-type cytochrome/quinol oxidase subunit 3
MTTPTQTLDIEPQGKAAHERWPVYLLSARAPGWWGTVFLIVNEAVLFASLIAGYFYIRFNTLVWPPQGIEKPELTLPIIGTVLLLANSLLVGVAEGGIRRGDQSRLRMGLGLGFLCGVAFLAVQVFEYSRLPFTPQLNVYTALFFGITGLHGLHVLVGLIASAVVQAQAWLGYFSEDRHLAVQCVGLYLHFVDVVWLVVFVSLYLSVHV